MAFVKKTWKDRLVEYAGRRKITNVTTLAAQIVDVERAEGIVSEEGSAFSAANLNDFEQRVADGFADVQQDVDGVISDLSVRYKPDIDMVQLQLNGSWVDWMKAGLIEQYLYKNGNQYNAITGGWLSAYFTSLQTGSISPTFGISSIKCSAAGTNQSSSVYTKNMIDITGYKFLTINVTQVTAFGHLVIANAVPAALDNAATSMKITVAGQHILDISKFAGKYYISAGTSCSDTAATHSIEFDSLKLS